MRGRCPKPLDECATAESSQKLTTELLAKFIISRPQGASKRTIESYHYTLDGFVGYPITVDGINAYLGTLVCQNGKAKFYSCLRALCNWLYQNGYVLDNLIKQVSPPRTQKRLLPAISKDQVDALILAGCIFLEPVDLLRLAAMTIYGARVGEVAALSFKHLDLPNKTITIPVTKKEKVRPQPIPEFMMGVFSAPIKPCDKKKLEKDLKRWCRLAGFTLPTGVGVHAIRRAIGTELHNAGVDIWSLNTFGRWSISGLGTGARYIKTPKQASDAKVLEVHPFVQTWREALELRSDISLFAKRDFCPLTRFFLYGRVV